MRAYRLTRIARVIVPVVLAGVVTPAVAQTVDSARPSVVEVQANPRGPGAASPMPPNPATAESPVPPAMPGDPSYHAGPYVGALTPPPASAMDKTYPVCTATLRDNCTNRSQAAHHAPRSAQPD